MIKYLREKPVSIQLWDRKFSCIEEIGGGVKDGAPKSIAILLDMTSDWVVYKWKHSGQIVIVPACDVLCIAADLPESEKETNG